MDELIGVGQDEESRRRNVLRDPFLDDGGEWTDVDLLNEASSFLKVLSALSADRIAYGVFLCDQRYLVVERITERRREFTRLTTPSHVADLLTQADAVYGFVRQSWAQTV